MKILRFALLLVMLSLVGCSLLAPPTIMKQPTKAEATYAKCQEVERYYLSEKYTPLPQISEPNSTSEQIFADGNGYFWNRPQDVVFLPSEEITATPALGLTRAGSYLSPRKITCDLQEGQIRIEMAAFLELEGKEKPLEVKQLDELWWDKNSSRFKGRVSMATLDDRTFVQNEGDFSFRHCNVSGVSCRSIDVLIPFPLPEGTACAGFAAANYGLELAKPDEIGNCTMYINNLNYFQDNPQQVIVFEENGKKTLAPHIQVVNDVWLEVAYQDGSVSKYQGADCFMQYTTNSQQDWNKPNFNQKLCSPREVIPIKELS